MRKDVKLGFAIGGVLLAVLIVYVLVVPGGGDKRLTSAGDGDATSQTAHNGGGGVSLEPVTPQPATKPSGVAVGTPPTAPPTNFTPPPGGTDPFEQPEAVAGNKSKEVDWSKLLNDSQAPTLMAPTAKAATATPPSSSSGNVQTALAGSPATPDITRPGPTPVVPPAQSKAEPAPVEPAAPANNTAEASNTTSTPPTSPTSPTPLPPAVDPPADVPPPPADQSVANNNAARTTTTDANGQQIHVVAAGETFSTISLSAYGNANLYAAIMRANPGIDPTRLRPGMKIVIPPAPEAKPAAAAAPAAPAARTHALVSGDTAQTSSSKVEAPIDPQTQYRVQAGDSLYSISKKLYGRGDRFPRIHEANKKLLGEDVNSLKTGQILTLPEPPTAK